MNINDSFRYLTYALPEDIQRCKLHGNFEKAISLIDLRLSDPKTSHAMKGALTVQRIICQMLPDEFPYRFEDALSIIQQDIPNFTADELQQLMDSRDVRWIYVEGEKRIFNRFYSSICKAVPGFGQRAGIQLPGVESANGSSQAVSRLDLCMKKMKERGSMTNRIRIRASVQLKQEFFTPGMFLRAHLPIPKDCPQQSHIRIEKIIPDTGIAAPADAPQRTVCWEGNFDANQEFMVEYSYLHTARYTPAYEAVGAPGTYDFDLQEQAPHILFTPYLRALCAELTQGLTDPMDKVRAFYDFITQNMHYTYMPSYVLLENIAESCAVNYTGDCGVFALLLVTLCRCAGIPAQWQSGLTAEPDFIGGHDWVRFYVAPYGWLFADPSYGTSAVRVGNEERRQFYFGNLDPYRMVANSAFYENFTIAKEQWRADPYDNQLGEIETSNRGFAFDEYLRSKEILECEEVFDV